MSSGTLSLKVRSRPSQLVVARHSSTGSLRSRTVNITLGGIVRHSEQYFAYGIRWAAHIVLFVDVCPCFFFFFFPFFSIGRHRQHLAEGMISSGARDVQGGQVAFVFLFAFSTHSQLDSIAAFFGGYTHPRRLRTRWNVELMRQVSGPAATVVCTGFGIEEWAEGCAQVGWVHGHVV